MGPDFKPSSGSIKIPIGGMVQAYRERYNSLSKRAKFAHTVYTANPGGRIIVHVKVPSEEFSKDLHNKAKAPFYYDVLLELEPGPSITDYGKCDVKVFSNCPSFVFSYAYVFAHWVPDGRPADRNDQMMVDSMKGRIPKNSLLINGLAQKIGPAPTHDKPVIRNPMGIPMFDKSIYYAIFYLQENVPLSEVINTHNNVTMQQIRVVVMDFDKLMNERKRVKNRLREKAQINKKTNDASTKKVEAEIARNATGMLSPKKAISPKKIGAAAKTRTVKKVKSTIKPKSTRAK